MPQVSFASTSLPGTLASVSDGFHEQPAGMTAVSTEAVPLYDDKNESSSSKAPPASAEASSNAPSVRRSCMKGSRNPRREVSINALETLAKGDLAETAASANTAWDKGSVPWSPSRNPTLRTVHVHFDDCMPPELGTSKEIQSRNLIEATKSPRQIAQDSQASRNECRDRVSFLKSAWKSTVEEEKN